MTMIKYIPSNMWSHQYTDRRRQESQDVVSNFMAFYWICKQFCTLLKAAKYSKEMKFRQNSEQEK